MKDKKNDKNLDNKKKDSFLVPEINPLDEIKNYSSKKKLVEKVGEELLPEQAVFTSMKNDKEKLRKKILENRGDKVENIAKNINAESRSNGDLNIVLNKNTYSKKTNYKKQKTLFVIFFLLFVFLLIGGVSYFILNNNEDLSDLPKIDPQQQIILSSMKTMKNVKTYNFTGDLRAESITKDVDGKTITKISLLDVSGKINEIDVNYPEASYNLKIRNNVSFENKNEFTYFDLDMLTFGNNDNNHSYVKLNEYDLNDDGMLTIIFEAIIKPYVGSWYVIKSEDLENITKDNYVSTTYDINKINDFYDKYKFIKFDKDLGDTKLNNVDVYHYRVLLNSDAVVNFYLDTLEETVELHEENNEKTDFEKTYNISATELRTKIEEFRNNPEKCRELIDNLVNSSEIEIWIGKTDGFVHRIKTDLNLDKDFFSELPEIIFDDKENHNNKNNTDKTKTSINMSYKISFDFNMFDFNKPVKISKPKDAENFSDVIMEISKMFDSTTSYFENDSDLDGLTDDLENYYGTDINNSDTDGDGYSDGDEVNNGYDPLVPGDAKLDINKLIE